MFRQLQRPLLIFEDKSEQVPRQRACNDAEPHIKTACDCLITAAQMKGQQKFDCRTRF